MSVLVIDDVEIARALHVVFVAHWIGGVAFVTLVGLPLARASGDAKKGWTLFEAIETRFAAQVRVSIPLPARPGSGCCGGSISGACWPAQRSGGWMPWSCSGRCLC